MNKILIKTLPLIIGAFFLSAKANLPNQVTVINKTSQDLFIITQFEGPIREGSLVKKNDSTIVQKHENLYYAEKQYPKYIYCYDTNTKVHFNSSSSKYENYTDKINLKKTINQFLNTILNDKPMEKLKLNCFDISVFYFPDNQLIIILQDKN